MLSKPQRTVLVPYIRRLPLSHIADLSLQVGTCRSLTRLTRTLWMTYRSLVAEMVAEGLTDDVSVLPPTTDTADPWDLPDDAPLDPPYRVEAPVSTLRRSGDPLVRLREEGDFG